MPKNIKSKVLKLFTQADLDRAECAVNADPTYGEEGKLIRDAFQKFPLNNDRLIIAMKVGLIDVTNSTNLSRYKSKISISQLSDFIAGFKDLDTRIEKGDVTLIKELCQPLKGENNINLFSFFSKYCCYHNMFVYDGDAFSIYDTILKDHIPEYTNAVSKYGLEKMRERMDYEAYAKTIDDILASNGIKSEGIRRKFDNLVWYYNR
jgi:hypothetical protein